jgi:sorting nexin-29
VGSDKPILERWAQHFEALLNGNALERVEDMTMVQSEGNFETEEPVPTINEIEQAIQKLRNNKSAGIDFILVKFAGPEYVKHLHQLIVKIWITEIIPEESYLSIVCPIHKKCDVMVGSNHKGISLLCIAYKIFSNILFNRLSPCFEGIIGHYQCGYCQTFTIRQVLEKCNEYEIEIHNLFIDFRSAYDAIDRENLYRAIEEMHIPRKFTALVRATIRKIQCQTKIQNMLSSPIITRNEVRQGDSLACLLFNIALEKVVREAGVNTRGTIFS